MTNVYFLEKELYLKEISSSNSPMLYILTSVWMLCNIQLPLRQEDNPNSIDEYFASSLSALRATIVYNRFCLLYISTNKVERIENLKTCERDLKGNKTYLSPIYQGSTLTHSHREQSHQI